MAETFYIDSNIFIFTVIYNNENATGNWDFKQNKNNEIIAYISVLTYDWTYCNSLWIKFI